jgi:diadenosine tetraphosphatase ApaH/serine/threonine PP2A family protein phosphatase
MRIAILSDVHSNLAALRAVLAHADAGGELDGVWCLGDIVGYGAEAAETIALLRERPLTAVAGNHDYAATGVIGVEEFNPVAAEAAMWTGEHLSVDDGEFLRELPTTAVVGDFTLVHGSLREPVWEYLLEPEQAEAQFELQTTPYSLIGHSHLLFWVRERTGGRTSFHRAADGDCVPLDQQQRLIINPGSAGQPRDGDPRVSYVLYDADAATITWHRVEYDIAATQKAILAAGLPPFLAERLAAGR